MTIEMTPVGNMATPAPNASDPVSQGGAGYAPTFFSGVCNGTLGELLQGPIVHAGQMQIAIISLPIRRYSWVHYLRGAVGDHSAELSGRPKCRKAIELYLRWHGLTLPEGSWSFSSELPWGRGMASSTADIVATLRCLDAMFGRQSDAAVIAAVLREIERSDSVFLESYALYLSGLQEVIRLLPGNPAFHVCYIDEERAVDTEGVTPRLLSHYAENLQPYERNLAAMLDAFDRGDVRGIGRCATESAILGQGAVPKKSLAAMQGARERFGADGIVIAHTGSLIGYLFADRPGAMRMGELSAFFRSLGYQCQYAQAQF
jgi:uncharacterized protein involved in propanediol utilization